MPTKPHENETFSAPVTRELTLSPSLIITSRSREPLESHPHFCLTKDEQDNERRTLERHSLETRVKILPFTDWLKVVTWGRTSLEKASLFPFSVTISLVKMKGLYYHG